MADYNSAYTGAQIDAGVAGGLSAVPNTRTVNGKALSANVSLTAADVGAVPNTRTVNGKALSANVSLTAADVGASTKAKLFSVTLSTGGWSNNTQTVNNANLLVGEYSYFIGPDPLNKESYKNYVSANVQPSSISSGSITFSCDETPSVNLVVNISREDGEEV